MTTSLTAYTHLESLLLFQSLSVYGFANNVFSRISELLKNNPSITSDKRFQSGRLSPDALRNFCLHLLKEEESAEQHPDATPESDAPNATPRNSRKRKAASPSFPTVQEAAQHAHLIPKLVTKLYARYRTAITREIRDEEDRIDQLQKDVRSIERGERDHELLERANAKSPLRRNPSLPRKSPSLQPKPPPIAPSPRHAVQEQAPYSPMGGNARVVDGPQPSPMEEQKPQATPNGHVHHGVGARQMHTGTPAAEHPSPARQFQPPLQPQPLHQPPHQPSPLRSQSPARPPVSSTASPHPGTPLQTARQHPSPIAPYNGPVHHPLQPSPYPQTPHPHGSQGLPLPTTHALNRTPSPLPPHPPFSGHQPPMTIPSGAHFQPPPLRPHSSTSSAHPPSVTGSLPPYSPLNTHGKGPYPPPHQPLNVSTPQPPRGLPHPGQPPYGPPLHAQGQPPLRQGGFMLPTFQVSPQDPSRVQQVAQYPQVSTPLTRQPAPVAKAPVQTPATALPQFYPLQPLPPNVQAAFGTPAAVRTPRTRTPRSTWRRVAPEQPRPEVAPLDDVPIDAPKSHSKPKSARKGKAKAKEKEKEIVVHPEPEAEPEQEPEHSEDQMETRQGRGRRKGAARKGRPGSLASTRTGGSVRDRSRSQSIVSHADENESSTLATIPRIKSERGTSFDAIDEKDADADADVTATPSHPSTRRRGAGRGRKRTAREASIAESSDHGAPDLEAEHTTAEGITAEGESAAGAGAGGGAGSTAQSRIVIAPRHFSRMCNPIMNDIASHKHASVFTSAVKPKNAEGYYEIIKRPTDLKSIHKAIAAGAKIVAAAAANDPSIGTPAQTPSAGAGAAGAGAAGAGSPAIGGGGGVVELPLSEDTMPPKAIVNSAQLENELMRMFVNAVMFNPGEDGVVEDAREMGEAVVQSVSNWRSAERSSGLLDVSDMGREGGSIAGTPVRGETEEKEKEKEKDEGPAGKRRKV